MKQIDVAIAILVRDGLIAITRRRAGGTFPGMWEFPGGKCNAGESPAATLARELVEELGVRIAAHTPLRVIEHQYTDFSVRLHPFLCTLIEGEPQPIAADELRWVLPTALRDYPFPPANAPLLEEVNRAFRSAGP